MRTNGLKLRYKNKFAKNLFASDPASTKYFGRQGGKLPGNSIEIYDGLKKGMNNV
jgi:hypothetical protein